MRRPQVLRRAQRAAGALIVAALAAALPFAEPARAGAPAPTTAVADLAGPLQKFLAGLHSYSAHFTQQVRDAEGKTVESGAGNLLVARPGRFRWEYRPADAPADGSQLLVADGKNLWFFDRELEQATVKPQAAALGTTPMLLLTGSPEEWRGGFSISTEPRQDGLDWQAIVPLAASADFTRAELGFRGDDLVSMRVRNALGQEVEMQFSAARRNGAVDESQLRFVPAAGVDVVGQALP